jgi:shikimate dehydrogenase
MQYGLLGEHLTHSYSKIIHEKLGLYPYDLVPLPPEAVGDFLIRREFSGLNVTIPYKTVVAQYCDVVDPEALTIGAINTLYFKNGKLHGANTDYHGLDYAARKAGISFAGKKVLLLGGGGTSRTARSLILDAGAKSLVIAERNPVKDVSIGYDNLPKDAEIIVNTTPAGMFPNNLQTLVTLSEFPDCIGVVDVIYNPFSTMLVMEAKGCGIPCTGGLPMLVAQALRSAELFTGRNGLLAETDRIVSELETELSNIVLIGMPGSGKSSMAKKLAKKINKQFVDLDHEISRLAGKSIPDIFREDGEPRFRALESQVAMEFGKKNSLVIATGGGIVLNPQNMLALKQNGKLVFVDRPVDALATVGRPLSTGERALLEMEQVRRPLYEKYQDMTIKNQGPFIKVLEDLIRKVES